MIESYNWHRPLIEMPDIPATFFSYFFKEYAHLNFIAKVKLNLHGLDTKKKFQAVNYVNIC